MGTRYIEMSICVLGWVAKDERANVDSTAIMRESLSWVLYHLWRSDLDRYI